MYTYIPSMVVTFSHFELRSCITMLGSLCMYVCMYMYLYVCITEKPHHDARQPVYACIYICSCMYV